MSAATKQQPKNGDVIEGTATELVVRHDDPNSLYRVLDRRDELQVEEEIKGNVVAAMAYEFEIGGSKVQGLSYAGINAAVRTLNARGMARIVCPPAPPPQFSEAVDDEGDPAWECMVYAQDEIAGGGAWGIATQKRFMKKRDGTEKPDTFAKTKALSKAQRNAKAALIPEQLKQEILAELTHGPRGGRRNGAVQRVQNQAEAQHREQRQSNSPDATNLDDENTQLMNALDYLPAKRDALLRGHKSIKQKRQLNERLRAEHAEKKGGQS
jgi:hypothetical protein